MHCDRHFVNNEIKGNTHIKDTAKMKWYKKTIRQKYVHKQFKMESQRNVAYIKNKKNTQ